MLLDPDDPLSEIIPLSEAAQTVSVSPRTINRWVRNGHLNPLQNLPKDLPGKWVTRRAVHECERDRHLASRQGRPGARVSLTV